MKTTMPYWSEAVEIVAVDITDLAERGEKVITVHSTGPIAEHQLAEALFEHLTAAEHARLWASHLIEQPVMFDPEPDDGEDRGEFDGFIHAWVVPARPTPREGERWSTHRYTGADFKVGDTLTDLDSRIPGYVEHVELPLVRGVFADGRTLSPRQLDNLWKDGRLGWKPGRGARAQFRRAREADARRVAAARDQMLRSAQG